MADVPTVVRRPVPIEHIAVSPLAVPIPLHFMPQPGNRLPDFCFGGITPVKVLPRREQGLNHKGGFDQVAAVVVLSKIRPRLAGAAVKKVRPNAMEPIGPLEKPQDLKHSPGALVASDELSF